MSPNLDKLEADLIRDDLSDLHEDVVALKQKNAEHEVRFGNGREVMAEMKADIAALKPKAPDWLKLLGFAAGLLVATLGAYIWLIEQFNGRPTGVQLEKAFHEHGDSGHASTQRDINTIRDVQTEQRVILDGLKQTVSDQGQKLDLILQRLPEGRNR
jgi:hypothetical protein